MADMDDNDPTEQKVAHLVEWLRGLQVAKHLEPEVTKQLRVAEWEADAMRVLRCESPGIAREMDVELARNIESLKAVLPLIPTYPMGAVGTSSAVGVTSAGMVYEGLIAARAAQPQPSISFQTKRYSELQEEQGREAEAAKRVTGLFPELAERFAEASKKAHVALGGFAGSADEEAAATAMRTFLYKLRGELLDKARRGDRENMTWALMAERLCTGPGAQAVLDQERLHNNLIDQLSRIGKARLSEFSFKETWPRFIDHVYAVCGAVLAGRSP